MEMKNINETNDETQSNNDPEDHLNNNLNHGQPDKKKKNFSIMKIKKFKNKYYQRSVHSILFIICFLILTLINFYGFELLFNYLSNSRSQENADKFGIIPRIGSEHVIQINGKTVEQLSANIKDYLKQKSPENCKSNPNYFCHLINETQNSECSEGQNYGFKYGVPCILIDLKPVLNSKWLTSNKTLNSRIHLKCDGEKNIDKESVGPIQYYPRNGIPVEYFTSNGTGTVSPAIFVQLTRPANGVLFFVECHVFAESKDEMNVFDSKSVKFEIIVDM